MSAGWHQDDKVLHLHVAQMTRFDYRQKQSTHSLIGPVNSSSPPPPSPPQSDIRAPDTVHHNLRLLKSLKYYLLWPLWPRRITHAQLDILIHFVSILCQTGKMSVSWWLNCCGFCLLRITLITFEHWICIKTTIWLVWMFEIKLCKLNNSVWLYLLNLLIVAW